MSDRPVVVVKLKGGVGNQLFQYAAGLTVAGELNGSLCFQGVGPHSEELERLLDVRLEAASGHALQRLGQAPTRWIVPRVLQSMRRRWMTSRGRLQFVHQGRNAHLPMSLPHPHGRIVGVLLDGYFQHPSWYAKTLEVVALALHCHLEGLLPRAAGRDVTVLSFRRGDYISLGWALPVSYYERALASIDPSAPVWVIGDDDLLIEVVSSWLRDRGFAVGSPPPIAANELVRDLALLAAADNVVMANSTFCWWGVVAGSFDADRTSRVIIAPASWIASVPDSAELIRAEWSTVASLP